MPTRRDPSASPGERTHSCSWVYFRSSGYTALLRWGSLRAELRASLGLGELRGRGLADGGDVEGLLLVDLDGGPGVLELRDGTVDEAERSLEGVRLTDHVEDVRRGQQRAVDPEPARRGLDGALRDQPDLAVDLHRLRSRRAELLDGVEHRVDVDRPRPLGDGHPDAGAGGRDEPGQDAELLGLLLRRLQRRGLVALVLLELAAGALEPADVVLSALRGDGQAGEHVDEVGLAGAGEVVVGGVGPHLGDRSEAEGSQE